VYSVTRWAAERARRGVGPTLIEHVTYRADAHSTSDDPSRYRPRHEERAWPLGDPIERLKQHMIKEGCWSDAQHDALSSELGTLVDDSWQEALTYGSMTEGPWLDKNELFEDVFKDMPNHLILQRDQMRALEQAKDDGREE
jgi:2-oxoisovalerate dehydrogenase E1 component alpha subunit